MSNNERAKILSAIQEELSKPKAPEKSAFRVIDLPFGGGKCK